MNRPAAETLSDRILSLLTVRGALKATEIADSLHCDRKLVNQTLYGHLARRVTQNKDYRWTVNLLICLMVHRRYRT